MNYVAYEFTSVGNDEVIMILKSGGGGTASKPQVDPN